MPPIATNLTVTGPTAGLTIDGHNQSYSAFTVSSGTFVCSGLTLANNAFGLGIGGGSGTAQNCTFATNNFGLFIGGGRGTALNCTFATNAGGLVIFGGSSTALNCTFASNTTGLYINGGSVSLSNSIVAGNTAADIYGTVTTDGGYNLIGTGGSSGTGGQGGLTNGTNHDQVGVTDAKLGALANNGGPTQTFALLTGSPAINAGDPGFGTLPATDQRGLTRVYGGRLDIGAYEAQPLSDVVVTTASVPNPYLPNAQVTYTITVTNSGPDPASTVAFTDTLPADTTFVSFIQNSGPAFTVTTPAVGGTGNVTSTPITLAGGSTATFTLVLRINGDTLDNTMLANTIAATATSLEASLTNNTATGMALVTTSINGTSGDDSLRRPGHQRQQRHLYLQWRQSRHL